MTGSTCWCSPRLRRWRPFALALACVLGQAACSDDDVSPAAQDAKVGDAHPADSTSGDAAADAVQADAGVKDALTDGGGAGVTDGLVVDGGPTDAGVADGGGSDAGAADGGAVDGGTPDAGPSDAGSADAADGAGASPSFPFQTVPGATNEALRVVFDLGFEDAETADEAATMKQARDAALAAVAQDLPGARTALLAALEQLAPDDYMRMAALAPLLREVGDAPELVGHLQGVVMTAPDPEAGDHEVPGDEMKRQIASRILLHLARNGSAAARTAILSAVAAPDAYTAMSAIRYTYLLSPDRREAQRSMRALMDPSRVWLLYRF